jgi:hypothetical protein
LADDGQETALNLPGVESQRIANVAQVDHHVGIGVSEPGQSLLAGADEQAGLASGRRVEFAEGGEQNFECQTLAAAFAELTRRSSLCGQHVSGSVLLPVDNREIQAAGELEETVSRPVVSRLWGGFFHER